MIGKSFTRILIFGGCLAVATALAMPAAASKPANESVIVDVNYQSVGVATSCNGGSIEMAVSGSKMLRADFGEPEVAVEIALPLAWSRNHPAPTGGASMNGCHGPGLPGSAPGFEGYFILDPGPHGLVHMASRFDYYSKYETSQQGRRQRPSQTVIEFFEINAVLARVDGAEFDWTLRGGYQTVRGEIELLRFEKTPILGSTWTPLGSAEATMTITFNHG